MYADTVTDSMQAAIDETARRRKIQSKYNKEHGIVPKTIQKAVHEVIEATVEEVRSEEKDTDYNKDELIKELTAKMKEAAKLLQFELAAQLRDEIARLKE